MLIVRQDHMGDVLLSGPAVRAVAAGSSAVIYLCGPRGAAAAALLPGVDEVVVRSAEWIDAEPQPLSPSDTLAFVEQVAALRVDQGIILTSFHQSPLPMALLLRLAHVPTVGAISVDYAGTLLDIRHSVPDDVHEVERALSLVSTLGYRPPPGDDGRLEIRLPPNLTTPLDRTGPYVVVHPGASVSARAWWPDGHAALIQRFASRGRRVVVTGGSEERALTADVARVAASTYAGRVIDLGGQTDLATLAGVLAGAQTLVAGNTGAAHLAAAVGTPVVSLYAPTVPHERWHPWGVPHILLGDQSIGCANCRARICPVAGHPCIDRLDAEEVEQAVDRLIACVKVPA